WFGNIVTMKWWDELWLNEAFAVFTQYIGVDAFKPGWSMMDRCYVEFVASALQTDSLLHSHPIIVPGLSDPNEIESMFDDISYFKGSALIRMLDAVIGRRTLKRGLIIYLNRFPCRNAASSDLFAAFSEAYMLENGDSGPHANSPVRNLTRVMDTWTTQTGFPSQSAGSWMDLEEGEDHRVGSPAEIREDQLQPDWAVPVAAMSSPTGVSSSALSSRGSATPWSIAMHKISEIGPMIAGDDQQAMTDLRSGLKGAGVELTSSATGNHDERYDMAFTLTEVTRFAAESHTEYDIS
uniref:Peptidase_M1 domain-containing protein n=1 Tax=Macrostomum lignano TaxID=282301 RepID=A0A1I8F9P4_9PLAT